MNNPSDYGIGNAINVAMRTARELRDSQNQYFNLQMAKEKRDRDLYLYNRALATDEYTKKFKELNDMNYIRTHIVDGKFDNEIINKVNDINNISDTYNIGVKIGSVAGIVKNSRDAAILELGKTLSEVGAKQGDYQMYVDDFNNQWDWTYELTNGANYREQLNNYIQSLHQQAIIKEQQNNYNATTQNQIKSVLDDADAFQNKFNESVKLSEENISKLSDKDKARLNEARRKQDNGQAFTNKDTEKFVNDNTTEFTYKDKKYRIGSEKQNKSLLEEYQKEKEKEISDITEKAKENNRIYQQQISDFTVQNPKDMIIQFALSQYNNALAQYKVNWDAKNNLVDYINNIANNIGYFNDNNENVDFNTLKAELIRAVENDSSLPIAYKKDFVNNFNSYAKLLHPTQDTVNYNKNLLETHKYALDIQEKEINATTGFVNDINKFIKEYKFDPHAITNQDDVIKWYKGIMQDVLTIAQGYVSTGINITDDYINSIMSKIHSLASNDINKVIKLKDEYVERMKKMTLDTAIKLYTLKHDMPLETAQKKATLTGTNLSNKKLAIDLIYEEPKNIAELQLKDEQLLNAHLENQGKAKKQFLEDFITTVNQEIAKDPDWYSGSKYREKVDGREIKAKDIIWDIMNNTTDENGNKIKIPLKNITPEYFLNVIEQKGYTSSRIAGYMYEAFVKPEQQNASNSNNAQNIQIRK